MFPALLRMRDNQIERLDLSDNILTSKGLSELQPVIDDITRIKSIKIDMNLGIPHS
jgi:hypothetical protein